MTWACDQRLAYMKARIDDGYPVNRAEVAERFNCTKQTVASDWRRFEQRFPGVAAYCGKQKAYVRADLAGKQDWRSRALAAESSLAASKAEREALVEGLRKIAKDGSCPNGDVHLQAIARALIAKTAQPNTGDADNG